jgi:hypothetical protein
MGGAPKGPLQYDLAKFTEVYGRPGHPTECGACRFSL